MDKVLRPKRLESDPNRSEASREWNHWKITFDNFVAFFVACHEHKLCYNSLSFWRALRKREMKKMTKSSLKNSKKIYFNPTK